MRSVMQTFFACLLVLAGLTITPLVAPETALALDTTVDTCDWATFSDAVDAVQNDGGGTITFDCTGVIDFAEQKVITSDVTIIGNGEVIFDGGGMTRFFVVSSDARLALVNLTLRNGKAPGDENGGAIANDGTLEVVGSSFIDNSTGAGGGVIVNIGTTTVTASTFNGNSADGGGAIGNDGALEVIGSSFSDNSASNGGGAITNDDGTLEVVGSTFSDNNAVNVGGAIDNLNTTTVTASTFSGNSAGNNGGAIRSSGMLTVIVSTFNNTLSSTLSGNSADFGGAITNDGTLDVTASTFSGNRAGLVGGAIRSSGDDAVATVTASTFSGNSAGNIAGAIYSSATLRVTASDFSDNSGPSGGAISNLGTLDVTDSAFSGNSVDIEGGAILNTGTLRVTAGTFSGNSAFLGGAFRNNGIGTATVTASTFSGNEGVNSGGAIRNEGLLSITASTFSGNSAIDNSGSAISNFGTLDIAASILASSLSGDNCSGSGPFSSNGYNLSDDDSCNFGSTGDQEGDAVTIGLGALQDNGGPTETMLPGEGSDARAAIPAGDCLDYSTTPGQRGVSRPQGDCEIGAVELGEVPVQIVALFTTTANPFAEGHNAIIRADAYGPNNANLVSMLDCDGDGSYETTVSGTDSDISGTCSFPDDGSFTVGLKVCDSGDTTNCDTSNLSELIIITNVSPTVTAGEDQGVDEGDQVTVTASFTDPGTADEHSCTIDWGDETSETGTLNQTNNICTGSHTYVEDGSYTVEICVSDDDDGQGCDTLQVTVGNVAPSVEIPVVNQGAASNEGDEVTVTAGFSDPGTRDQHTCQIDWGDGTVAAGFIIEADGSESCAGSHTYVDNDGYTVTVEVCGDDKCADSSAIHTVNNVAPTVDVGDDQSADEGEQVTVTATFSDPGGVPAGPDTHLCRINWGDGMQDDDTGIVDQENGTCTGTHSYADNDTYTVEVCLTDDGDGEGCDSLSVTVGNVAPTVESIEIEPAPSDEGSSVELLAHFSDPGTADTHTCTITWGDGTVEGPLPFCAASHTFVDGGTYTVEVCVSDDDEGQACDTLPATVSNVAPTVETLEITPASPDEGSPVSLNATFSDPGTADEHTCEIAWGDGTSEAGTVDQTDDTCAGAHTYVDEGSYTVEVCVTEAVDGQACDMATVVVSNAAPVVDAPQVSPSPSDEATGVDLGAAFTDSGTADTHNCTIDWSDGTVEPGTVTEESGSGSCAGSHLYVDDGDYNVTVEVCEIEDADSCGANDMTQAVNNLPPTIHSITTNSPVQQGDPAVITIDASDPAGEHDPLTYHFDCDDDGGIDVGPQAGNMADCQLDPAAATTTITVEVSDDDGGVTTGLVTVEQVVVLCGNSYTGAISSATAMGCPNGTVELSLPAESATLCVSTYTGGINWSPSGVCNGDAWVHTVPDDGPLTYCENIYTGKLRYNATGQCTLNERAGVIPG